MSECKGTFVSNFYILEYYIKLIRIKIEIQISERSWKVSYCYIAGFAKYNTIMSVTTSVYVLYKAARRKAEIVFKSNSADSCQTYFYASDINILAFYHRTVVDFDVFVLIETFFFQSRAYTFSLFYKCIPRYTFYSFIS